VCQWLDKPSCSHSGFVSPVTSNNAPPNARPAVIAHAQQLIEAWRHDYNQQRPHGALGQLTRASTPRAIISKQKRPRSN